MDAGKTLPYLTLADSDTVQVGDPVLAVGNPLGIGTSVSSGIISALNRNLRNSPFDDYVQTDAAINHGNSGGPLLNTAGRVIGVNTILLTNQKNEGSNGLGFAISSVVVNYVVQHLENPAQAPVGWIGTHVQDVTSDLARAFGMPQHAGCVITKLDANSPARQAGLHSGEVILAYNDNPVRNARELMREVAITPIGRVAPLQIWMHGAERTVRVTIHAWPNLMEPRGAMLARQNVERPIQSPNLGMLLAPLFLWRASGPNCRACTASWSSPWTSSRRHSARASIRVTWSRKCRESRSPSRTRLTAWRIKWPACTAWSRCWCAGPAARAGLPCTPAAVPQRLPQARSTGTWRRRRLTSRQVQHGHCSQAAADNATTRHSPEFMTERNHRHGRTQSPSWPAGAHTR